MAQMYKVFIDNGILEFVTQLENLEENTCNQTISEGDFSLTSFLNQLKNSVSTLCLRIICTDSYMAIQTIFSDYHWVEAAGGIVKKKDAYLFIKRNGMWDIPKGMIDACESPELAAVREIEEECGIVNPRIHHLITTTFHTYEYQGVPTLKKTWWYALNYEGDDLPKPQVEEGITEVCWLERNQWNTVLQKTYLSIQEVLLTADSW